MTTLIWSLTHACPKDWVQRFQDIGIKTLQVPFVRVELVSDCTLVDSCLRDLGSYDGMIFTSRHAVKFTWERIKVLGLQLSIPVHCIGTSTVREIQKLGLTPSLVAEDFSGRGLAQVLAEKVPPGQRLLFLKSIKSDMEPWKFLEEKGVYVESVDLYEPSLITYEEGAEIRQFLDQQSVIVTFGSPSAVEGWVNVWESPDQAATVLEEACIAILGLTTSRALQKLGKQPNIFPDKPTAEELCSAIFTRMKKELHVSVS
ncbi:MAG: uroporphyrinogen-III synthase [Candidatus Marinimicrobia bacterium]|nr:uroporphyrinogen-III synthase [Candidatus Neomarinimicrobiota bacterium]